MDSLSIAALGILSAASFLILWRWLPKLSSACRNAQAYAKRMQECGYLPDAPSERGQRWLLRLASLITFVQVGRIKVDGAENLDLPDGPYLVTPNHPHYVDVAVMPLVLQRPARYMAAKGVMTSFWGYGGLLFGPMGAFAADLEPGKGGPAREAAVEILVKGKHPLVMFPEGWAYLDGETGPFKKGAVRIARQAAAITGQDVHLIPVHLQYGTYPGKWIRTLHPKLQYLLVFLLFILYRRSVLVHIGKPIAASSLPQDDTEATEFLKRSVLALKPEAKKARK